MIKLLTIIGARPQIIKAAAISRAVRGKFADCIEEKILHTGQHYDENMSGVFFDELGIPKPDYNLGVGSGIHGAQTAKMIAGIEEVLMKEQFDGMILYGDTNSTLAGAVAASKLHIPVFHIEAGLRSYNMAMPEEINRIVCDQVASICFAPTETAMRNLREEGFETSKATFANGRKRKIVKSGDVMYDNSMWFSKIAEKHYNVKEKGEFALATIHRDNNTDSRERLTTIFKAIEEISKDIKVVLPLHPRTLKMMEVNLTEEMRRRIMENERIEITAPASFLEMTALEKNARIVLTDSGGVQKEAFFFERPCVILRPETEWVEITEHGAGIIADASYEKILEAYRELVGRKVEFPPLFGNGKASEQILNEIIEYLK
ncbi:MAG: UDP-N-acetylglucosamine 2-epimerase (non-hydrolyzing) [Paludibacteraceae bacterium]|nr:UDP-N-acetylglucosamine 2-epimerase (non-hydrolyzing) [Paludibacteraceae bacterium]